MIERDGCYVFQAEIIDEGGTVIGSMPLSFDKADLDRLADEVLNTLWSVPVRSGASWFVLPEMPGL